MLGDPNGLLDSASKAWPLALGAWGVVTWLGRKQAKGRMSNEELRAAVVAIDRITKSLAVLEKAQQDQDQKITTNKAQAESTCKDVTECEHDIKDMRAQVAKHTSTLEFMRGQRTRDRASRGDREDNG